MLAYGYSWAPSETPKKWIELNWSFDTTWRAPKSLIRPKTGLSYSHNGIVRNLGTVLALNTKRCRGACWNSRMGLRRVTSYSLTRTCIKPTNKLVSSLSGAPLVLGQTTGNFGLTWIHHGLDSREAITFPHILYSMLFCGTHIQMAFCLGTPKKESQNCPNLESHDFTRSYSLLRPPIGMRSEANL